MRIVLDAMGSDTYPVPDVAGAVLAAKELGVTVILVGDEAQVRRELAKHNTAGLGLEVVHAPEAVAMTDKPSAVTKSKPQSSMHIGMNLVKDGKADGFVTAGNTGACLAIATLSTLHRISGVKRPALSAIIPMEGRYVIIVDAGANSDAKAEWLAQFAVMGDVYARSTLKLPNPRVAMLSNGEEEGKGTALIHEATALIQQLPLNFIGNVEPKELLQGAADVIVCDGFVGNIAIKSFEGLGSTIGRLIRNELKHDVLSMLGGLLAAPALRRMAKQLDPSEIGGAPLLGVNGVVIIGHGRSDANAIKNAIRQANQAAAGGVIQSIRNGLQTAPNQTVKQ
jgi:glycerol-3-phosphate acyltransferase PlsX